MKKLIGLLFLAATVQAATISSNYDQMFLNANAERNYLLNSGAEKNDANVTDSSSIHSRSTSSPLIGVASHLIDGTGSSQNVDFAVTSLESGLLGTQCEALFLLSGDASLYTATVRINSADVTTAQTLPNTGSYSQPVSIVFPCGVSGVSPVLRITSTSASAAAIKLDTLYFGKAVSLGNVNQIGDWISYTPTVSPISGYTISPYGYYRRSGDSIYITAGFQKNGSAGTGGTLTISLPSGLSIDIAKFNTLSTIGALGTASSYGVTGASQWSNALTVDYQSATTLGIGNPGSGSVLPGTSIPANSYLSILAGPIPIVGWTTTSSYSLMNTYWKIDASIQGANPSLGTSSVSTYSPIENGSLTLTNNSGTGNIAAQIGCSSTNAPSGTTCSAGSESVSVSFTPLGTFPQDVLACASFTYEGVTGTSLGNFVAAAFQVVETATNAQTILQEGKTRIHTSCNAPTANATACTNPVRVCGNLRFDSPGQKMLRLMYEQAVGGTPSTSAINGDAASTVGQRDIHWEVYPLSYNTPAPILVGGVTSGNTTGGERVERANTSGICSASPCTIGTQSGAWVTSITRASTGLYTVNFATGVFSSTPTCLASCDTGNPGIGLAYAESTSNTNVACRNDAGTATDSVVRIHCQGPR